MQVKDKVKSILRSKGFTVSDDSLRIRNLLGERVEFERVVGIVEGKLKISWRYNPGVDGGEINIAVYDVGEDVENLALLLESKGVVVEVVDESIYGKVRFKGKGIDKLEDITSALR